MTDCLSSMTSLNMPGFSISLVRLPSETTKVQGYSFSASDLIELLDAPGLAPAWKNTPKGEPSQNALAGQDESSKTKPKAAVAQGGPAIPDQKQFIDAVTNACKSAIAAEPEVTKYDSILGDGDCVSSDISKLIKTGY